MLKIANLSSFWKPEAFGQTVLPDRSLSIGQKLVEKNVKIQMSHSMHYECDEVGISILLWGV